MATLDSDDLDVCPASDMRPERIAWLWPGRLALGKVALFEGDPDLGKSLVALDLCARLSTGRPLPDGTPRLSEPLRSIYLGAEDGPQDTILPRLLALGADASRVFVMHRKDLLLDQQVSIPTHVGFLDRILARTGARLLVLDPIVAFLAPEIIVASDQSVRRALRPLAALAEKHACAIVLIRHLNKKLGGPALYRGGGSIGFLAACRAGWLFALDPQPEDPLLPGGADKHAAKRCVMAQVKNNLAAAQPSLAYELRAGEGAYPTVHWLGPCAWTHQQLVARPRQKHLSPGAHARQFLKEFLADGPRLTADIWVASLEQDISKRTLQRARKEMQLGRRIVVMDGKRQCYWLLPGQQLPGELRAAESSGFDAILAALDAKYSPGNPLDEEEA
jgi:hypothetical protein